MPMYVCVEFFQWHQRGRGEGGIPVTDGFVHPFWVGQVACPRLYLAEGLIPGHLQRDSISL